LVEKEGHPIDEHLFKRVGKELAVGGKTKTAELYYYELNQRGKHNEKK